MDLVPGGKGDKTKESDVCPKQLKVGIAVEKEHTSDIKLAKEIAIDHLTEDPEYYSKLIKSGLADEPEAIQLAKQLGLTESLQMRKLRNVIKEEVRKFVLKENTTERFKKNGIEIQIFSSGTENS